MREALGFSFSSVGHAVENNERALRSTKDESRLLLSEGVDNEVRYNSYLFLMLG